MVHSNDATECNVLEVNIDRQTEQTMAYVQRLCRIPSRAQTIWHAVSVFDFLNTKFGEAWRIVLTSPDESRYDTDLWPPTSPEVWPKEYRGTLNRTQYLVSDDTMAMIDKIKTDCDIESNDELMPLLFANLLKINKGIMEYRDIHVCNFAGGERRPVALQYPPYGYQLSS